MEDVMTYQRNKRAQNIINALSIFGIVITIYGCYWAYKEQLFTSEEALRNFLGQLGEAAPLAFIGIQIVQTVIPIIPGALTIPMGAMVFGMWYGFVLNFIGIMIGSVLNFLLARRFGRPLVEMLVSEKDFNRYVGWLDKGRAFDRIFTFGMFFPFSPADALCYLAGLSSIKFSKYLLILSLGKPFTLWVYSYGTMTLIEFIAKLLP